MSYLRALQAFVFASADGANVRNALQFCSRSTPSPASSVRQAARVCSPMTRAFGLLVLCAATVPPELRRGGRLQFVPKLPGGGRLQA